MLIRHADPARDAAACAAIYGPFVADTPVSLEEMVPSEAEIAARIERISAAYPWLVAEQDGHAVGFAYGSAHRERAAYRWAADVTVYVSPTAQRRGVGTALYEQLLSDLARQGVHVACAGITLPNEASVGAPRGARVHRRRRIPADRIQAGAVAGCGMVAAATAAGNR